MEESGDTVMRRTGRRRHDTLSTSVARRGEGEGEGVSQTDLLGRTERSGESSAISACRTG